MPSDHEQSHFKLFLQQHRDEVVVGKSKRRTGEADAVLTHTLMCGTMGGKLAIPPELLEAFYDAYGRDASLGRKLYVVEVHTLPCFIMHLDVDFKALEQPERVQAFCELVHATVAEYYRDPVDTIVCAVLDERGERRPGAAGLHFIFPRTAVTTEQALCIRAGIVARCLAQLPWGGDWEHIIDISVLSNKGGKLRMVGSDKCRACPQCALGGCTNAACQFGRVCENKLYWPWKWLPVTETTQRELGYVQDNKARAAKLCSVRCRNPEKSRADFAPPRMAPLPSRLVPERVNGRGVRNAEGGLVYALRGQEGAHERGFAVLHVEEALLDALQQEIRNYHPNYGQLSIKRGGLLRSQDADSAATYLVKVRGYGERFCCNKGAEHRQNVVYFAISRRGGSIYQRCHCVKTEIRAGGCSCREYSGRRQMLPPDVFAALCEGEPLTAGSTPVPCVRVPAVQPRLRMMPLF
jgi:hypothetical protein